MNRVEININYLGRLLIVNKDKITSGFSSTWSADEFVFFASNHSLSTWNIWFKQKTKNQKEVYVQPISSVD